MRIAFDVKKYPYHVLRPWVIQPIMLALFFLSPVTNLFRADMLASHLIFLGKTYPFEIQYLMWIPIGFYAIVLLVAIGTAFLGRIFCGWACPHNILTEWTKPLRTLLGIGKKPRWLQLQLNRNPKLETPLRILSVFLGLILTILLSFLLFSFVVPFQWQVESYLNGSPHPTLVMGHVLFTLIGIFSLLAGHIFCETTCPYGLAQSISAYQTGKWRPMEIHFKGAGQPVEESCGTCTGCQQVCPVNIDPRGELKVGVFEGCWNCGECIDACKQVHDYKNQPSLLHFGWPWVPEKGSLKEKKAKSY